MGMSAAYGKADKEERSQMQEAGSWGVGNDKETLLSALTQYIPYICFPRTMNACIACINEMIPADK